MATSTLQMPLVAYNGVDNADAGYALDARQGKRMADSSKITSNLTLQSGWSSTERYAVKTGRVVTLHVRGLKRSSAASGWNTAFTLPTSLIPANEDQLGIMANDTDTGSIFECKVSTSGNFQIYDPKASKAIWGSITYIAALPSNIT